MTCLGEYPPPTVPPHDWRLCDACRGRRPQQRTSTPTGLCLLCAHGVCPQHDGGTPSRGDQ